MHLGVLEGIIVLLTGALVAATLFRRMNLPPVIGYLAVGVAVGNAVGTTVGCADGLADGCGSSAGNAVDPVFS